MFWLGTCGKPKLGDENQVCQPSHPFFVCRVHDWNLLSRISIVCCFYWLPDQQPLQRLSSKAIAGLKWSSRCFIQSMDEIMSALQFRAVTIVTNVPFTQFGMQCASSRSLTKHKLETSSSRQSWVMAFLGESLIGLIIKHRSISAVPVAELGWWRSVSSGCLEQFQCLRVAVADFMPCLVDDLLWKPHYGIRMNTDEYGKSMPTYANYPTNGDVGAN